MIPIISTLEGLLKQKKFIEEIKDELRKRIKISMKNIKLGCFIIITPSAAEIIDLIVKKLILYQ